MNRPSLVTYLIGNPIVVIGLWISTAVFGYRFWHGELNFIPALVAGGIANL